MAIGLMWSGGEGAMTGRWRELLSVLADLGQVGTACLVLAAYAGYLVGRLSRRDLAVAAVVGLGLLAVLAWWRRRAWWRVVRPKYVSAVVWLARPVRDELAAMLLDDGDGGNGGFEEELRQRIGGLSIQALGSLRGLLRAYHPGGGCEFRVGPQPEDEGGMGLNRDQRLARIALACAELEEAGFISEQRLSADGEKVEGYLAPWVRPGLVLRLLDLVEEELEARGVRMSP